MRKCPKCNESKVESEFVAGHVYCKLCKARQSREWRRANRAKNAASQQRYVDSHTPDWAAATREKSRQLGQSYSTAAHTLRKRILFQFVQRLSLDTCFKCGGKIVSVEDLSIEHKVDWLHSADPIGLFFSLDNIAFSHRRCNRQRLR